MSSPNDFPYKSTGTLHYSPKLLGEGSKWWLVLWTDPQLVKYYRHLHHLDTYYCDKLQRPAWDSHITVIRDEEPPEENKPLWLKYENQTVEFSYSPEIGTDGNYCWLPVYSLQLLDLRTELGLPREPYHSLHLSIGHRGES